MAGNGYATSNRKKILEYLAKNCDRTVKASDIDEYLIEMDSRVNVTTIYRYLEKLVGDGKVIKYAAEKGKQAVYQYVEPGHKCEKHLHLTCTECGRVIHLECDFMEKISEHILDEHGFELQCKNSMLYGICENCRK